MKHPIVPGVHFPLSAVSRLKYLVYGRLVVLASLLFESVFCHLQTIHILLRQPRLRLFAHANPFNPKSCPSSNIDLQCLK